MANLTKSYEPISERSFNLSIGISILIGVVVTALSTVIFKNTIGLSFYVHPIIFSILYLVLGTVVGNAAIRSNSTGASFGLFLVLSVMTGALLSAYIPYMGTSILANAAIGTIMVVVTMIVVSSIYPKAFAGLGRALLFSLLIAIIAEILLMIFFGTSPAIMDWIVLGIFSLYIGYDWSCAMTYPPSNKYAIMAAISLYMDIINIFVRLVSIFSRSSNQN